MARRTTARVQGALAVMGVVLAACLAGCKAQQPEKLSSREAERVKSQIAEASSFTLNYQSIWQANQLLQEVFRVKGLESSDPELAAKAHRVMAGVYFGARLVTLNPEILLPEDQKICEVVKSLGQGGLIKAARELEASLQLDPTQADASKIRKALPVLRQGIIPGDQLGEFLDLLLMSFRDKSEK